MAAAAAARADRCLQGTEAMHTDTQTHIQTLSTHAVDARTRRYGLHTHTEKHNRYAPNAQAPDAHINVCACIGARVRVSSSRSQQQAHRAVCTGSVHDDQGYVRALGRYER